MSFGAVAGITLAIAVVVVVGVALMSYVSSLVKNAYQIKVELRSDVESAIARMEAEMDRRGKSLRKELGDDAAQLREAVRHDNERRVKEIEERLQKSAKDLQDAARTDKAATQSVLADMQKRLKGLEADMAAVKGELARRAVLARAMRDKDRAESGEAPADHAADTAEAAEEPTSSATPAAIPSPSPVAPPVAAPPAAPSPPATSSTSGAGGQRFQYNDFTTA